MSLSSARLHLYLLAVWNSKIPLSSLKKSSTNQIFERDSAVLFIQFNFVFKGTYPNLVDPTSSFPTGVPLESSSSDMALSSYACDIGSKLLNSECSIHDWFMYLTGSLSSSLPLDSSSLSIDTLNHSVLVWFSIPSQTPLSGSVDIKFG